MHTWIQHQSKAAVGQFLLRFYSHRACKMQNMQPASCQGNKNRSVLRHFLSSLGGFMETHEEIRDFRALYVLEASSLSIVPFHHTYILEVLGVLHPCLIADGGCRWLKAGALRKKKKKGKNKKGKKEQSTWSLCCNTLGQLSLWLALFLQQRTASSKTCATSLRWSAAPLPLLLSYT